MVEIVVLFVQIFMIKKVKNFIFFIFLAGTLWPDKLSPTLEEVYHIDLNIYDGVGSLLLHWSIPDKIEIKEVNVFRKTGLKDDFKLSANISSDEIYNNRFLDINCKNSIRYFYYVEVIDADNNIYKSDHLKPSFGSIKRGNIQKIKLEQTALELFKDIIRTEIIEDNAGINMQSVDALINLMLEEIIDIDLWVENFPLSAINDVSPIFEAEKKYFFEDDVLIKFQNNEQLYRNYFLLTPEEWKLETKNIFTTAKNNWFVLKNSFQDYVKVINSLSPIIILGAESQRNKAIVELLVVNNNDLDQNDVKLSFLDEHIPINYSEILSNQVFQRTIPENWTHAKLIINDKEVDHIELIEYKKISKTLKNEIIPTTSISSLKMSKESSEIWINEISWNSGSNSLSIEVAGTYTGSNKFIISANSEDIWALDFDPSFELQYIDSTFDINIADDIGHIVIEHNIVENNKIHTLELFKIYAKDDLNNHRFPDGEKWIKTDKNTFGSKNIDKINAMDADLIPELFVLYQNYPNPFNSTTRISFDLLQDATLSLYVTDATGRIKTTFSDKEFYNSGKYNFDWNAESFSTGVYFFTINAEVEGYLPFLFSRKMIYLK